MIKIKVNDKIVKTDGDWFECPECDYFDCILLKWMNYCPNCATPLNIEECNNDIKSERGLYLDPTSRHPKEGEKRSSQNLRRIRVDDYNNIYIVQVS